MQDIQTTHENSFTAVEEEQSVVTEENEQMVSVHLGDKSLDLVFHPFLWEGLFEKSLSLCQGSCSMVDFI